MNKLRFKAVRKSDGIESFNVFDLLESIKGSNHCAGAIDIDSHFSFNLSSTPDVDDIQICQSIGMSDYLGNELFENDAIAFKVVKNKVLVIVGINYENRIIVRCQKEHYYELSLTIFEMKEYCTKVGNVFMNDKQLLENIKMIKNK